jgi:hypothetical protein
MLQFIMLYMFKDNNNENMSIQLSDSETLYLVISCQRQAKIGLFA